MKLSRCPVCHSHIHLDQLVQDEAGRQLLGLMSKLSYHVSTALVGYLALFRTPKRDLDNGKALTLAQEALALTTNHPILAEALRDTVDGIARKRQNGESKPLPNHNYLKKVLADKLGQVPAQPAKSTVEVKLERPVSAEEERRLFQEQMQRYGGRTEWEKPHE